MGKSLAGLKQFASSKVSRQIALGQARPKPSRITHNDEQKIRLA